MACCTGCVVAKLIDLQACTAARISTVKPKMLWYKGLAKHVSLVQESYTAPELQRIATIPSLDRFRNRFRWPSFWRPRYPSILRFFPFPLWSLSTLIGMFLFSLNVMFLFTLIVVFLFTLTMLFLLTRRLLLQAAFKRSTLNIAFWSDGMLLTIGSIIRRPRSWPWMTPLLDIAVSPWALAFSGKVTFIPASIARSLISIVHAQSIARHSTVPKITTSVARNRSWRCVRDVDTAHMSCSLADVASHLLKILKVTFSRTSTFVMT